MRNILFVLLMLLLPMLYSCTTYTHSLSKDEEFISSKVRMTGWKKIAVLPFSGYPIYNRVFAEQLSYYIQEQPHFEIIGPAISEIKLKKRNITITKTALSHKEIIYVGKMLGADAILMGSFNTEAGWGSLSNISTRATLIDIKTGEIIAQDEEVIIGELSITEKAKRAIKFSAYEILTVLYALAGDPREFQILKERPPPTDTDKGALY